MNLEEMTDVEIDECLALAIGYEPRDVRVFRCSDMVRGGFEQYIDTFPLDMVKEIVDIAHRWT